MNGTKFWETVQVSLFFKTEGAISILNKTYIFHAQFLKIFDTFVL